MAQDLKYELKKQIIEELNLEDMKPEDIKDDGPLFGDGLGSSYSFNFEIPPR